MTKLNKKKIVHFLKSKKCGYILAAIQFTITVLLLGILIYLNMVPEKYFLILTAILVLLTVYIVFTQSSKNSEHLVRF